MLAGRSRERIGKGEEHAGNLCTPSPWSPIFVALAEVKIAVLHRIWSVKSLETSITMVEGLCRHSCSSSVVLSQRTREDEVSDCLGRFRKLGTFASLVPRNRSLNQLSRPTFKPEFLFPRCNARFGGYLREKKGKVHNQ